MQSKTFNRLVISSMALAILLPALLWLFDYLTPQSGWFAHLFGSLALMAIPVLWLIGNLVTGIAAFYNKHLVNKLFWLQCVVSVLILAGIIYLIVVDIIDTQRKDLKNNVLEAIKTRDINQYKQSLTQCGDVCRNQDNTQSVTNSAQQYDKDAYKDWLTTAVAAQALPIVDALLTDKNRPNIPLVGSGSPYLSLDYACRGYYVGDANVYQIAVLQKSPKMLMRLIASASIEEKSSALWYAASANRIDYIQLLLSAGASRNIKDAYGVIGLEDAGYSLLDAAVEGFAIETLQWLLNNGFAPNGPLGKTPSDAKETPQLKHTPLHRVIFMAHQEQSQFNSLARSVKMWQILKNAGADDTIAEPRNSYAPQTPLQALLESNVYDQSAKVVQTFMQLNIASNGLSAAQQTKLAKFLNTSVKPDANYHGQLNIKYCAETRLGDYYQEK